MPTLNVRVQQKRDTEANFTSQNPVLLLNEVVYVDMTAGGVQIKIGDGTSHFNDLPYIELGSDIAEAINEHNTAPDAHASMGWVTTEDAEPGEVEDLGLDADSLGGVPASNYALKTDLTGFVSTDDLANYVTTETFNSTIGDINSLLDQINGEVIN